jgi:hypothetical protein
LPAEQVLQVVDDPAPFKAENVPAGQGLQVAGAGAPTVAE